MIKILFVCHGSTEGSRELAALVGQNGANHGNSGSRVLRFTTNRKLKIKSVGNGDKKDKCEILML